MPKAIDLTGKKFGNWLVLYRAENNGREVMWHCKCSCGVERDVNSKSLKSGKSTSCGCSMMNTENIIGKRFGTLFVVSQDKNICHCVCENCGKYVDYTVRELVNGRNKSCGCLLHKDENLVGNRFGKLIAIEKKYNDNNDIGYICKCDCGNEKFYLAYQLRNNLVKSCGCAIDDFSGKSLVGYKFGKWTVKSFSHRDKNNVYYWNCVCECGTEKKVSSKLLKSGLSKSCGCSKIGTRKKLEGTKIGKWTIIKNIDALRWLCKCDCGNERIVYYSNIERGLSYSCGCEDISHSGSKSEKEIKEFIISLIPNIVIEKSRILGGKEIDIYLPEYNVGIEYNGSLFHANVNGIYNNKSKDYHFKKFILAKEKGIHLLSIFDVDWNNNKYKIKCIIKDLLVPCKRIYARNCILQYISKEEAVEFYNKYHLQGASKNHIDYSIGLYYNDELLSVMSFSKRKFCPEKFEYELYRYCVKPDIKIIGGAEKLFKNFISTFKYKSILSYSDNDYFSGDVYERLGFEFDGYTTIPYYWYFRGKGLKREQTQLRKLKKLYPDLYNNATGNREDYIMKNLGARKIYRCGNTRWVYRKGGMD